MLLALLCLYLTAEQVLQPCYPVPALTLAGGWAPIGCARVVRQAAGWES